MSLRLPTQRADSGALGTPGGCATAYGSEERNLSGTAIGMAEAMP